MLLNWQVVADMYESLIDGRQTLEDADLWAANLRIAHEYGSLQFNPKDDEADLWEASQFLCGIDLTFAPGEYLYSIEQVKQEYKRRWKRNSA